MRRLLLLPALLLTACPETPDPIGPPAGQDRLLVSINSCSDLEDRMADAWLEMVIRYRYGSWGWFEDDVASPGTDNDGAADGPTDYSETNVQEAGVDEPDLVKTDGQYIYSLERGTLFITDSWPVEDAHVVAQLQLADWAESMFLDGDRLVVFSYDYEALNDANTEWRGNYGTRMQIIDITDRANPAIERSIVLEGWLADARRIDGDVYVVTNGWLGMPQALWDLTWDETLALPEMDWEATEAEQDQIRDDARDILRPLVEALAAGTDPGSFLPRIADDLDGGVVRPLNGCDDLLRPQEITEPGLLNVAHFDLRQGDAGGPVTATSLLSNGWEVYASQEHLYVSQTSWWWWWGWGDLELNTHVHMFDLDGDRPEYLASGAVPGWTLNQFSYSEFRGDLRVATTDMDWWWGTGADEGANNVFVLRRDGGSLDVIGEVRDIAPGERIFGMRFLGDRGYMVTFRQTDPLFTFDLSDATDPRIMGELHVPGYSSYLHPIDDDHLLTVGMDGTEDGTITGFAVSIFDVSDMANPTLLDRLTLQSDDWSWSESLWDHHAFTFHRGVLSVPVYLWNQGQGFSGMLVVDVDVDSGLTELGRVGHQDLVGQSNCYYGSAWDCQDWYWYAWMRRSVVIEDNLFSFSEYGIKVNDLNQPSDELARILYWPL